MGVPDPETLMAVVREMCARHARTLGREEAADLAAEALARGLRHPPPDGRFRPWLEGILRNLVADHWRQRARDARCPPEASNCVGETPEEVALGRERRQAVRRSLLQLPREVRRALLLRYYLETEGPAAARRQGVSTATVRTRIHRGLARLRVVVGRLRAFPMIPAWRLIPAVIQPAAVALLLLAQEGQLPPPTAATSSRPSAVSSHSPRALITPVTPSQPVSPPPVRQLRGPVPAVVQRLDFGDDVVEGELQRPEGVTVPGYGRPPRLSSLIEIPDSMVPAIVKSLEDL